MTTNNEDIIAAINESRADILERLDELDLVNASIVQKLDSLDKLYWKMQSDVNDVLTLWHEENKWELSNQ
jgi:hypothetical protein